MSEKSARKHMFGFRDFTNCSWQLNTNFTRRFNLIEHFRNRWKLENLTSLREYHRNTENNRQEIKVGGCSDSR